MREKCVSVPFSFDPAVLRYLETFFNCKSDSVDLRKSVLYSFIILCLSRITYKSKKTNPSCFSSFIEGNIVVKEWDYTHYGENITPEAMIQVNNLIYKLIIREACYRIMIAHVYSGIPRDTCIKDYLFEIGYKDDELSYGALRKYYQRNWTSKEKELRENIQFSLNENEYKKGTNSVQMRYTTGTQIFADFVPMGFRY